MSRFTSDTPSTCTSSQISSVIPQLAGADPRKCGGESVGYFPPRETARLTNLALARIVSPIVAAYELH